MARLYLGTGQAYSLPDANLYLNYRLRPIAYLGEQTDFAKEVICGVDALKGTVGFVESNKPIPC